MYFLQENEVTLGQVLGRLCQVCDVRMREEDSYSSTGEGVPKGRGSRS